VASPASQVVQRIIAATIGGYVLAAAISACVSYGLSHALAMPRADAALTGLLVSFVIYVAVVMWVFAARSLQRLWWQLGSVTAVFATLAVLLAPVLR
jgi:hypothetical protein